MSPQLRIFQRSACRTWRAVLAAMCAFAIAGPGAAQAWGQWEQTHKLTADDGAVRAWFGFSTAISRGIAIAGSPGDDDAGSNSGSAYLFSVATGKQLHKLTAADASEEDVFGWSVSISGAVAIVGAIGADLGGAAYLFDVTTGQQLHKLTATDASEKDIFGSSVSISGGIAIVGAFWEDDACPEDPDCNSGSAYLFDVATGEQLYKLTAKDPAADDQFGFSVSMTDGIAIVGAWHDDDACPNGPDCNSGSAYLFDVATGEQLHKLAAADAALGDRFGVSVSTSWGFAIVGTAGSAYIFDVATGEQLHKLFTDEYAAADAFGYSVGISNNVAIIGAIRDDDACRESFLCDSGAAYLFDVSTGAQLQKLTADDAAERDTFGWSVAISGGIAIVGALRSDDACPGVPVCDSGSAYVFQQSGLCDDEDGDGRVTICHIPPGNPENAHTITVSVKAVPAHLAHGDHCGPCESDDGLLASASGFDNRPQMSDCVLDLNGDAQVGPFDLALLLGAWGTDPAGPPDFNGDGNVGPFDLALVLGSWGPCP